MLCYADQKDSENDFVILSVQDISMQKRSEEENFRTIEGLRYRAQRDSLTGLYNRAAAKKCIDAYLAEQHPEETSALMIVDLDNFKSVNDTLGSYERGRGPHGNGNDPARAFPRM